MDVDREMMFLYDPNASKEHFSIKGENFKYLIKVRRHQEGDILHFRNKDNPDILYTYKIQSIEPRALHLSLIEQKEHQVVPQRLLHVGWCVIDTKSIEKVLAGLNEVGVERITFIYCERSQKNFKLDMKRFERIIEASNQQCGRSKGVRLETTTSLQQFLQDYPDTVVLDFSDEVLEDVSEVKNLLVGCEGGFSKQEKEMFQEYKVRRLNTPLILRSETALLATAGKILL